MTPDKPSASEAREPATAISQRLENIMTWLREPDWTEQATLEWIKDWVDRRPIAELAMVAMLMPSPSPAVNAHLPQLVEFFKWAMREAPWDGCDLDGGVIQDKAESLGLIVQTKYDVDKHGLQGEFDNGDDYFEFAPALRLAVASTERRDG